MEITHVRCSRCGERASQDVMVAEKPLLVRAFVECPECIEKQPDLEGEIEHLRAENLALTARNARLEKGLEHYAADSTWFRYADYDDTYKPGTHGWAVAREALKRGKL